MAITRRQMEHSRAGRWLGVCVSGLSLALITGLGAGCAHTDKRPKEERPTTAGTIPSPKVPAFLNGAMAVLLTNVEGFRAHVVLQGPASTSRPDIFAGELMSREGKLFFAPEPGVPADKRSRAEEFSYIWNVTENRGFLLNGPLQGYAPISSPTHITNVVVVAGSEGSAPERAAGYLCQRSEVKVASSDGEETTLQVWRAKDLKGIPVRIARTVNGAPLTLTLSKVRFEAPPSDLFMPPTDFTRYSSAEIMINELVARQQNQKRKRGWQPPPSDEVGVQNPVGPGIVH
jgi:hypothetical protein